MALTRITKGVIKPNENYDTHNIVSTGIVTAIGLDINGNGDVSGDLNVGGVLTYEDVTSIDSVGLITARNGIDCNGDLDVDGHTNLDNVSIAGVSTLGGSIQNSVKILHNSGYGLRVERGGKYIDFNGDWGASGSTALNAGSSGIRFYYGNSSDGIQFNTGSGDDKVRITSDGKVGIGTIAPTEKLTILGNVSVKQFAGTDARLDINESTTTNPLRIMQTATEARIQTIASQPLNIRAQGGSGSSSHLAFWTRESERFRIDASGRFLLGHTTSQTIGSNSHGLSQIVIDQNQPALTLSRFENVVAGPSLVLGKSRSGTIGNYTVVQSGDGLGNVAFAGADGNDLVTVGANIEAQVDGTPGSNDMPTRLVFATTRDGDSSPTESLRIHSGGQVTKLHNPRFQVYMSGSHFQLSSGSGTITYNAEVYDTGSNYNTSNGRFTAPVSGAYYFHHCLEIREALSGTGVIESKVWVIPNGGSAQERIRDYTRVDDTNAASHAFGLLGLNAGDQVYPAYYNGVSGNCFAQNNGGNTPLTTFFEGYLIQ